MDLKLGPDQLSPKVEPEEPPTTVKPVLSHRNPILSETGIIVAHTYVIWVIHYLGRKQWHPCSKSKSPLPVDDIFNMDIFKFGF